MSLALLHAETSHHTSLLVVIPYVAGMRKDIKCVCRKFNIRVVFKSRRTLRSMLIKVKDTLPLGSASLCLHLFTFALMTTGAFSRNIGKSFSELQLVTDNLNSCPLHSIVAKCTCFSLPLFIVITAPSWTWT